MGKWLLADFAPSHTAWLRYAGAAASFWIVSLLCRSTPIIRKAQPMDWLMAVLIGATTFGLTPLLQQFGLNASRATDNALLIAMEPLMHFLLAWLMLGERITRKQLISLSLSLTGFSFLSGLGPQNLTELSGHLLGNLLIVLSLTGEALYSPLSKKLIDRYPSTAVFGTSMLVGSILLSLALFFMDGLPDFSKFTLRSAVACFWVGPLGTAGTYFYWMLALKRAPVMAVALTLFVQPLLGWLLGAWVLGEQLSLTQSVGGVLIILSMAVLTDLRAFKGR
jgi:drug/metabolite transporter (DMT)-like permease